MVKMIFHNLSVIRLNKDSKILKVTFKTYNFNYFESFIVPFEEYKYIRNSAEKNKWDFDLYAYVKNKSEKEVE